MLDDLHIPPSNILFAGDSAGGGLCLALLMYLRDNAYPLPAGAILMSPWVGGYLPLFLQVVTLFADRKYRLDKKLRFLG